MPPKLKVTKNDIIDAALKIVREEGADALNARSVARSLNVSTQPIFSNYASMEELKTDVIAAANVVYNGYINDYMSRGDFPPYKASGIAYVEFARKEKELFKLLFMRDRRKEHISDDRDSVRPILDIIRKNNDMSEDEAYNFHIEIWIYVHGIATMIATSYLELPMSVVSDILSDVYNGLISVYKKRKEITDGSNKN